MFEPVISRTEPSAGVAEDRVAAPAQVAKRQVLVRVLERQDRLEVAELLISLDQVVAEEHDAVARFELDLRALGRGRAPGQADREAKRGEHGDDTYHEVAPDRGSWIGWA